MKPAMSLVVSMSWKSQSFAGTIAEGEENPTKGSVDEAKASKSPPKVNADADLEKAKSVDAAAGSAEPEEAIETADATGRDEL